MPAAAAWCDESTALRWAGRPAVLDALARAERRAVGPSPEPPARARAGRALAALYKLQESDHTKLRMGVGERSPRLAGPAETPAEDAEAWLRIETANGQVTARGGLGRGDQPQVIAYGEEHDVALPDWGETARRLSDDDSGLRPRATRIETLLHIARRTDATRVLAETTSANGSKASTHMTRAELLEALLATSWPTATPNNARIAWWMPAARAAKMADKETTARLELERTGRLSLEGAELLNLQGDAARMDTLVRALLETGKRGAVRWTDTTTPRVTGITARPRSAR